jgi:hypothetical protein
VHQRINARCTNYSIVLFASRKKWNAKDWNAKEWNAKFHWGKETRNQVDACCFARLTRTARSGSLKLQSKHVATKKHNYGIQNPHTSVRPTT